MARQVAQRLSSEQTRLLSKWSSSSKGARGVEQPQLHVLHLQYAHRISTCSVRVPMEFRRRLELATAQQKPACLVAIGRCL